MRVVIAEDQALLRTGLVRLLRDAGFDVVAEAADAADLVRKVAGHRPDVVVTDVRMPPGNADDGLRAAREIRERFPGTAVMVLSQYVMERATVDLVATTPLESATCSKTVSQTSTRSSTHSTASPAAAPRWTPTSSRG